MRKLILSTTAMLLFVVTMMNAQTVDVKVRPLALASGDFKASAELLQNKRVGFELNAGYNTGERLVNYGTYEEKGYEAGAMAKFYFAPKKVASGLYGSVYGNYINTDFEQTETDAFNNTQFNVGFLAGYKKVYKSGFFFEYAMGLGRSLYNENTLLEGATIDISTVPSVDLKMPGRFSVGIRF